MTSELENMTPALGEVTGSNKKQNSHGSHSSKSSSSEVAEVVRKLPTDWLDPNDDGRADESPMARMTEQPGSPHFSSEHDWETVGGLSPRSLAIPDSDGRGELGCSCDGSSQFESCPMHGSDKNGMNLADADGVSVAGMRYNVFNLGHGRMHCASTLLMTRGLLLLLMIGTGVEVLLGSSDGTGYTLELGILTISYYIGWVGLVCGSVVCWRQGANLEEAGQWYWVLIALQVFCVGTFAQADMALSVVARVFPRLGVGLVGLNGVQALFSRVGLHRSALCAATAVDMVVGRVPFHALFALAVVVGITGHEMVAVLTGMYDGLDGKDKVIVCVIRFVVTVVVAACTIGGSVFLTKKFERLAEQKNLVEAATPDEAKPGKANAKDIADVV